MSARRPRIAPRAGLPRVFARLRTAWAALAPGRRRGRIDPGQVREVTSAAALPRGSDLAYSPPLVDDRLDADALRASWLSLAFVDYDFLLFSRTLLDLPTVRVPERLLQSVVFRPRARGHFLDGSPPTRPLRGRLVRVPGLSGTASGVPVERLFPGLAVRTEGPEILVGRGRARPAALLAPPAHTGSETTPDPRPCVFVWPALWAVGGVERLAIEVMRQLQERYEFVVVTTERLASEQGSLHHELKALEIATYDLGELGPPEAHLGMLAALKRAYRPMVVWLCNGSPWLCDHAREIRQAYADTPIVAQLAYDTRAGWINRYHEPGLRSFDRHVAINRIIERCLVDDKGLDPAKVDLIYHAYDESHFDPRAFPPERVRALREAHGFPPDEPLFVFVGRMTAQKRPLDFVHLAETVGQSARARFLMVGDGDLAPEVDRRVQGVQGGRLERWPFSDRVHEVMAMADGFIITSEYEGLPIAMLEALAMGVPVLATDVGEIRVVLEELGAGMVVDPRNGRAALSEALARFREHLAEFRAAAVAAAPSLRRRFGGPTIAGQYDECWKKAASEEGRAARDRTGRSSRDQ